jgi:hypothetical protein
MNAQDLDQAFEEFKKTLFRYVDERIDERLEPLRSLILKDTVQDDREVGQMGDALQVAELLGLPAATEDEKKLARQKVYYMARMKTIPSVRVSARRVRFDLDKVRRVIASGGHLPSNGDNEGLSSSLQH